jgi:hypothetical protein
MVFPDGAEPAFSRNSTQHDRIASARQAPSATHSGLFLLLTNRNNLLDFLSAGMIKPAAGYSQQTAEPDLATHCQHGIPLLVHNPSPSLVALATGGPGVFPVVLDVDLHGLTGSILVLRPDYSWEESQVPVQDSNVCIVVPGVIPITRIRAVHFRSEGELEEHLSRPFQDVRTDTLQPAVSPDRFAGPELDPKQLTAALSRVVSRLPTWQHDRFMHAEGVGGALLMLAGLAARDIRLQLTSLAAPLTLTRSVAYDLRLPDLSLLSQPEAWLALLAVVLSEQQNTADPGALPLDEIFGKLTGGTPIPEQVAEGMLFLTSMIELTKQTSDTYYNEGAFEAIRTAFRQRLLAALGPGGRPILSRYETQFAVLQDILMGMESRNSMPGGGSPVLTGLLHFLLHDRPAQLWDARSDLPSHTIAIAVACCGALYGRSAVPLDWRPDSAIEESIDEMLAQAINRNGNGLLSSSSDRAFLVDTRSADGIREEILQEGDQIVFRRGVVVSPAGLPVSQDEASMTVSTTGRRSRTGISDADVPASRTEQAWKRLLESELKGGPEREVALRLCKEAGWDTCVTTVISLEGRRFRLDNVKDPRVLEVRIVGYITPELDIRVDSFRKQLTAENWAALPGTTRNLITNMLFGVNAPGSEATRHSRRPTARQKGKDAPDPAR